MNHNNDFVRELGVTALGTRLRRLFERLNTPVSEMYRQQLGFEQRWFGLTLLLNQQESITIGDAAASLGMSHASVLQIAKAMIAKNLLIKGPHPLDGRAKLLSLTESGKRIATQVQIISEQVKQAARELLDSAAPHFMEALDALDQELLKTTFAERLSAVSAPI